jgi:tRNA pseudouridine38-40 synthase
LIHALNFYLPEDVAVRELREAPAGFHAQFAATAKTYRYTIWNGWTPRPLLRDRTAHVRGPLDLAAMRAAAAPFLGKRDFRAFGSEGGRRKTTVRTLRSIRISRRGERVEIVVLGDGFLYNMVRCIAGTLIRAGQAKIDGREVERILREGDRRSAGPVAPARGLCLMKVHYGGRRGTPDAP